MSKIQLYLAASRDTDDPVSALSHVQFALAYFKLLPNKASTIGSVSLRDVQTQLGHAAAAMTRRYQRRRDRFRVNLTKAAGL